MAGGTKSEPGYQLTTWLLLRSPAPGLGYAFCAAYPNCSRCTPHRENAGNFEIWFQVKVGCGPGLVPARLFACAAQHKPPVLLSSLLYPGTGSQVKGQPPVSGTTSPRVLPRRRSPDSLYFTPAFTPLSSPAFPPPPAVVYYGEPSKFLMRSKKLSSNLAPRCILPSQ